MTTISQPAVPGSELLLRVVTRSSELSGDPWELNIESILRQDLRGDVGKDGKARSFSVVMICRCSDDEVDLISGKLIKDDVLRAYPPGVSARASSISAIRDAVGQAAFVVAEEPDPDIPHHAGIRFRITSPQPLAKPDQRHYRQLLYDLLVPLMSISKTRAENCTETTC